MKTKADIYFAMPEPEFRVIVQKTHRDYLYGGPTTHAQMKQMVHLWVWYIRHMHYMRDGVLHADALTSMKFYGWLLIKGWII